MITQHDKPSFDEVLEQYYESIFLFVAKQVGNVEDAKDLTQDIFIKTYHSYGRYNPNKASVKTWLFHIANNHIINFWKSAYNRHHTKQELNLDVLTSNEDMLEQLIQEEDVKYIIELMKQLLSKKHYKIMILYFFSDLSLEEIANVMSLSKKTISNVVSLSIKTIQTRLEDSTNE